MTFLAMEMHRNIVRISVVGICVYHPMTGVMDMKIFLVL
jgi:hypothetical protein